MIRVLIAEDQTLVREGLVSMLELGRNIEIVGQANDGEQAVELILATRPDVLLLDYRMPKLDGLGVLRALNQELGEQLPPTLILTTFEDDHLLLDSVSLGAKGFLLKDVELPVLLEAIEVLASGERWLQPAALPGTRTSAQLSPAVAPGVKAPAPFTPREQEVLRLMAGGLSNREIAELLQTTEGTVKSYVSVVLAKLGVRDRTRAVLKAMNAQLV